MGGLVQPGAVQSMTQQPATSHPDNLVTVSDPGQGMMTIMGAASEQAQGRGQAQAQTSGQQSAESRQRPVESSVQTTPADISVGNNLLDSFFERSAYTREDILVFASMVQLVAWGILLYHEVDL